MLDAMTVPIHFFLDNSVEVVSMASETLKKLLATKKGAEFCADYKERLSSHDSLFGYLYPFRASKSTQVGLFYS